VKPASGDKDLRVFVPKKKASDCQLKVQVRQEDPTFRPVASPWNKQGKRHEEEKQNMGYQEPEKGAAWLPLQILIKLNE
jgi:hypothetical protein